VVSAVESRSCGKAGLPEEFVLNRWIRLRNDITPISRDEAWRNRCSGFECSIQAQTQICLCLAKSVYVLRLCLFVALTVDLPIICL
jgi:hypothetical protein